MRVESLSVVVAELESGSRPKGGVSEDSGTIPSLGGEHLNKDGGFVLDKLKYVDEAFFNRLKKGAIKENDILIVKDGATTGKVSFVGNSFPYKKAAINEHLFSLRVNTREASPKYVFLFLKSPRGQKEILKDFRGAAIGGISRGFVELAKIPLPSLDDQTRIAHLLGKVEELISQRKQHLQHLDDLLKSVFLGMFGDPARNPKNHKKSTVGHFITHLTSGGRGWAKYYSPSGKRFIRSLDVQMNSIGSDESVYVTPPENKETERTRVQSGDVLLTITGSLIGRVCFVPVGFEEAYVSQHVAIIRTQGLNPVYLSYYLSMPNCGQRAIRKQQYGQAKPGLNLTQIRNFEIIEPDPVLQNLFATIVEKVDSIRSRYQQSLTNFENLYGALSQKAFRGELDLSRVPLPPEQEKPETYEQHEKESAEAAPLEQGLSDDMKTMLANLNALNTSAERLKTIADTSHQATLNLPQQDVLRTVAEQMAALRSPLQELKQMDVIAKAMERAQATLKPLNLEHIDALIKSTELARTITLSLPKIDMTWFDRHTEAMRKAMEPFETMRMAMERIAFPAIELSESVRLASETANRLQSSIPDFSAWQQQSVDSPEPDLDDEERSCKRPFTRADVNAIFAQSTVPLSFEDVLNQLSNLETVDLAGYETIRAIVFELLAEQQLFQKFDGETKSLQLASSRNPVDA